MTRKSKFKFEYSDRNVSLARTQIETMMKGIGADTNQKMQIDLQQMLWKLEKAEKGIAPLQPSDITKIFQHVVKDGPMPKEVTSNIRDICDWVNSSSCDATSASIEKYSNKVDAYFEVRNAQDKENGDSYSLASNESFVSIASVANSYAAEKLGDIGLAVDQSIKAGLHGGKGISYSEVPEFIKKARSFSKKLKAALMLKKRYRAWNCAKAKAIDLWLNGKYPNKENCVSRELESVNATYSAEYFLDFKKSPKNPISEQVMLGWLKKAPKR